MVPAVSYTCRVQAADAEEGMHGGDDDCGSYTYAIQRWLFVEKGVPLRLVRKDETP